MKRSNFDAKRLGLLYDKCPPNPFFIYVIHLTVHSLDYSGSRIIQLGMDHIL